MRILIFIISIGLFSKVSSYSGSQCQYLGVCADYGERCDFEYYYNSSVPSNQIYVSCKQDAFCPQMFEPVCTKYSKLGEVCNTDYTRCSPGLSCILMEGAVNENDENLYLCQSSGYLSYGEKCENDQQCYGGSCFNGLCRQKPKTFCGEVYNCPFGTFCDPSLSDYSENQCIPLFTEGEVCKYNNQCKFGLNCVKLNENSNHTTCQKLFSKQLGEYCYSSNSGISPFVLGNTFECQMGQSCTNNICTALTILDNKGQSCESSSSCNSGTCLCNNELEYNKNGTCTKNPLILNQECQETNQKLINCANENHCPVIINPNSCFMKKCSHILCSNNCLDFSEVPSCGEPKNICQMFGIYSSPSSIVLPSLFTIIIIIILNFLF